MRPPAGGRRFFHYAEHKSGEVSEKLIEYFVERAKGGVGLDVALFLREKGIEVTVLQMTGAVAAEINPMLRRHLTDMAEEKGVRILTSHKAVRIESGMLIAESARGEVKIECDNVLSAIGFRSVDMTELRQGLEAQNIEVPVPGHFIDAIHSGYLAAVDLGC